MRPLNRTAEKAEKYYYEKDVIFGIGKNSQWYGKQAESLKLSGPVNQLAFRKAINGIVPGTTKQVIKKGPGKANRAGIDLPLAPPKSVSILALHCKKKDLIQAHQKAVEETIKYIEKRYLYSRKTINKKTQLKKHRKGLFATFTHSTNRKNDPQLHTHVFIMNMVKTSKKQWQALYGDPIFTDQKLLGDVYRGFLKEEIRGLGYQIRNTKDAFEIEGVKNEWTKKFSKRRESIVENTKKLKNSGKFSNFKKDKLAYLNKRPSKDTSLDYNQLKELWEDDVPEKKIIESLEKPIIRKQKKQSHYMRFSEKIKICSKLLCEKEAVFKNSFLLSTVMKTLDTNINSTEKFIKRAVKEERLIFLGTEKIKEKEAKLWTTKEMVEVEKSIVNEFRKGKNVTSPLVEKETINEKLSEKFAYLTPDQKRTVVHTLTSNDRFSIVQGDAGTGKTTSMMAVKNILNEHIAEIAKDISNSIWEKTITKIEPEKIQRVISSNCIKGMGFTGKSAMELEKGSEIESLTIQSFLNKDYEFNQEQVLNDEESQLVKENFNPIWIVDESSMVASKDMNEIVNKALEENAKVVFVGDGKQLSSIGAGRMFSDLQKMKCVKTIHMQKVMRQKTPHMKKIVELIKNQLEEKDGTKTQYIENAFDTINNENALHELGRNEDDLDRIAKDYVARTDNTLVLCADNETKEKVNLNIRSNLAKESDREETFTCRTPISLSGVNKYFAESYKVGSSVFVQKGNNTIRAGQTLEIKEVRTQENTLVCDLDDKKIEINTLDDVINNSIAISPFKEHERTFRVGEKIVFTKNDRKLDVQNGLTGTITNLDSKGKISVKTEANKTVSFHINHYSWLDYGYAVTVHKSQGQTCDHVMFVSMRDTAFMDTSQSLYVAATRAKNSMSIYSDQVNNLYKRFEKMNEKTSTLDYGMER